jgi:hypothetical protein
MMVIQARRTDIRVPIFMRFSLGWDEADKACLLAERHLAHATRQPASPGDEYLGQDEKRAIEKLENRQTSM